MGFEKSNELFWSDNVFPEGAFLWKSFPTQAKAIDLLSLNVGHFILASSGESFANDAYMQGYQAYVSVKEKRFELFPSLYLFKNIPNIPDGAASFQIDYTIFHIGTRYQLLEKLPLQFEFDYYQNLEDCNQKNLIPNSLKDQ